jgi:hypothetical protein
MGRIDREMPIVPVRSVVPADWNEIIASCVAIMTRVWILRLPSSSISHRCKPEPQWDSKSLMLPVRKAMTLPRRCVLAVSLLGYSVMALPLAHCRWLYDDRRNALTPSVTVS